ncbi:MAG TPA: hypothetical protein VH370_16265 [Humisphaera sp.]|jgi:gas vesicle protein|nr:hypothetical protein [Humisphaera sp.]
MSSGKSGIDTWFLLGGALAGAAAMYLFDPQEGASRRRRVADAASRAADSASDVYENAKGWGSQLGQQAANMGPALMSAAGDAASYARDAASRAHDSAAATSKDWRRRIANSIDEDHGSGWGVAGVSSTALSSLAVGSAVMYFFDPQLGRARRTQCIDAITSFFRRTGKTMNSVGRQVAAGHMPWSGEQQDNTRSESPWSTTRDQTQSQPTSMPSAAM